jgi:hypothetical protein
MAFDVTETQLNTLLASYESLTSVWVDSGLSRPPLDFQPGNLLCWPERPGSAKSGLSSSSILHWPIRMKIRKLLLWSFVLALLLAVSLWLRNEARIDSCLDRGGRWDQEQERCEGAAA